MPPDHERDYEVGYGKPPRHTRFTKGRSGNPRGRSPGAKNLKTLLSEALNELVIVAENGGRRKVTKREAIIKQLVNQSATADWRAIKILLDLVRDIEGQTEPASSETSESRAAFDSEPDNNPRGRFTGTRYRAGSRRHGTASLRRTRSS
jgi:Family of unknown function (DUF5681)